MPKKKNKITIDVNASEEQIIKELNEKVENGQIKAEVGDIKNGL